MQMTNQLIRVIEQSAVVRVSIQLPLCSCASQAFSISFLYTLQRGKRKINKSDKENVANKQKNKQKYTYTCEKLHARYCQPRQKGPPPNEFTDLYFYTPLIFRRQIHSAQS